MGDQGDLSTRAIALGAFASASIAIFSVALAAASGSPYLTSDRVNAWIVVFAIALLGLLAAAPFALELRLRQRQADRDKRWETATVIWGAIAAAVLVLSFLLGNASGFSGSSLGGTIGLIAAIESGLVVLAVGAWLVAN